MARKYLVPIDLTKQELQNARIQNLASAPSSPVSGQIYYDTTVNALYYYNGSAWVNASASVSQGLLSARPAASASNANSLYFATDNNLLYVSNGTTWTQTNSFGSGESSAVSITGTSGNGSSTNYARADHTHAGPGFGSPASLSYGGSASDGTATTVSRSDHAHAMPAHTNTEHGSITLNALAAPTGNVSMGTYKLTSVGDPTSAQDAATKAYVDGRKVTDLTAPTSAFSMNSQKITNLATPTSDYDAANKLYVDQAVQGLTWKESVNLMSATNVPLTGSTGLVIDGHSALDSTDNGYRILLIGQTTNSQNGIYTFSDNGTTYTLSRATDADTHDELIGATVFIKEGTTYGSTSWVQTNHYLTDFTGQTWVQFSGAGTYTASNGVLLNVKNFEFSPKSDGGLATGGTGAYIRLQTNSGLGTTSNGLAVGAGTGITVTTGTVSVDTSVVARKYSANVGDNSNSTFTVTHSLGTKDVTVQVYTVSDGTQVEADVTRTTTSAVTVAFAVAPTTDQYRVVVIG